MWWCAPRSSTRSRSCAPARGPGRGRRRRQRTRLRCADADGTAAPSPQHRARNGARVRGVVERRERRAAVRCGDDRLEHRRSGGRAARRLAAHQSARAQRVCRPGVRQRVPRSSRHQHAVERRRGWRDSSTLAPGGSSHAGAGKARVRDSASGAVSAAMVAVSASPSRSASAAEPQVLRRAVDAVGRRPQAPHLLRLGFCPALLAPRGRPRQRPARAGAPSSTSPLQSSDVASDGSFLDTSNGTSNALVRCMSALSTSALRPVARCVLEVVR